MSEPLERHAITSLTQLQAIYGEVNESSARKEVSFIHPKYRAALEHPRSACGASPSRGRHQRPGKAGSAVSPEWARRFMRRGWRTAQ